MKKLFFLIVMLVIAIGVFAQVDSTTVAIAKPVLTGLETKYAWVSAVLGVLWMISEALAYIPAVKANSIFQLFFKYESAIENK